jgi:hypothetical protein
MLGEKGIRFHREKHYAKIRTPHQKLGHSAFLRPNTFFKHPLHLCV